MLIVSDISIGLRLALRARFSSVSLFLLVVMLVAAWLAAYFSGRQPATVALDLGLSIIRLILPLILVLLSQELFSREFDRRHFLNSLSYPRSREFFLLGRFLAVLLLSLLLLVLMAAALVALVALIGRGYTQSTPVDVGWPYVITIGFVALDSLVLAALACLVAVVASTSSFVLIGTFGFMLVARSFAAIVELLVRNATVVGDAEGYRKGVSVLGYLLPDLGALDVRMVALYGEMSFLPADWIWLLFSCLVYVTALLALAVWALQSKRFA